MKCTKLYEVKGKRFTVNWCMVGAVLALWAFMLIFLPGCTSGSVRPYAEVGVGYTIDKNSDWYLRTQRDWTCSSNDTFHGEVGLEFENDWTLGYHHQSHISCGGPFNNRPELYQDEVILRKKWGGRD